jgi:hypothetical protein
LGTLRLHPQVSKLGIRSVRFHAHGGSKDQGLGKVIPATLLGPTRSGLTGAASAVRFRLGKASTRRRPANQACQKHVSHNRCKRRCMNPLKHQLGVLAKFNGFASLLAWRYLRCNQPECLAAAGQTRRCQQNRQILDCHQWRQFASRVSGICYLSYIDYPCQKRAGWHVPFQRFFFLTKWHGRVGW